jgi:hypothetical protein
MSPATAIATGPDTPSAHHHGQRDQHLRDEVGDATNQEEGDAADDGAEDDAAAGLQREEPRGLAERHLLLPGGRGEDDREDDHADAVVEQALRRDRRLDRRRQPGVLEDRDDGDRIGRRDQRAEHQAPDQRHVVADDQQQPLQPQPDKGGREQRAERGQRQDRPAALAHVAPVDVEGAGEQQERQHAVEQRRLEVEAVDEILREGMQVQAREQPRGDDDRRRGQRAEDGEPDRRRQAQESRVDRREDGREHDDGRRRVEGGEIEPGQCAMKTGSAASAMMSDVTPPKIIWRMRLCV